jgi:hypothetical protein
MRYIYILCEYHVTREFISESIFYDAMLQVEPFCALFPATYVRPKSQVSLIAQSQNSQACPPQPQSLFSHNLETGDFPYLCANERPNPVRAADSTFDPLAFGPRRTP